MKIDRETADKYQGLFNYLSEQYGINLTIDGMNDLIAEVDKTKQLLIPRVSCSAYKDELIKKTESMIWFARENYNKEYYEGVLNAMRNLQVHIKKLYEKHYS